jgi:hypothetical protein
MMILMFYYLFLMEKIIYTTLKLKSILPTNTLNFSMPCTKIKIWKIMITMLLLFQQKKWVTKNPKPRKITPNPLKLNLYIFMIKMEMNNNSINNITLIILTF